MRAVIYTLVFNVLVAGFVTALGAGAGFGVNMVFSQAIGFSIMAFCHVALRLPLGGHARSAAVAAAVVAGASVGGMLGRFLTGVDTSADGSHLTQPLLFGLVFGGVAAVFFWQRERNAVLAGELRLREMAQLQAEKQSLAAQLRMLQAQIEPHFLFNSLANVKALIDTDSAQASQMLDALIRYLRSSLTRTRAEGGTLGDEVALLKAYLEVLKIRMGDRLSYSFDIAPQLLAIEFPPMLLQPLVENAIRHGLELKLAGGRITVSASRGEAGLSISVADDGLGFADTPGEGVGLANVRARLEALYGKGGRLELRSKVGAGTTAILNIATENRH